MNASASAVRKLGILLKALYVYNNFKIGATCFRSFVFPLLEFSSFVWMSAEICLFRRGLLVAFFFFFFFFFFL